MDNKIKITINLFLACILSGCIGLFDNDHLYERTINHWISLEYWAEGNVYQSDYVDFTFSSNINKNIGGRIEIDDNGYFFKDPIINYCVKIIYNNDFVLAEQKYIPNPKDSTYYKLNPTFGEDKTTPNGYSIDTITESKFNSLVDSCSDCKELTADRIRQLDYELDHGGFPSKTVLFILLVAAYVFYKIRKNKKK